MIQDELEVARAIAAGQLTSPQRIDNLALYAMRVSGTGVSYRRGLDEFVWRDPDLYLSQDMIDRCAGLPVIMEHPASNTLNSEEFTDRVVGGVMFGYVDGDELWCIARIYDDEAVDMMGKDQLSTSPAVVFKDPSVNKKLQVNGKTLLIEGKPSLLDHLAICQQGVWDKGGPAAGIDVARKDSVMSEEKKADAAIKDAEEKEEKEKADAVAKADAAKAVADAASKLDAVLSSLDSISKRMDAYDAKADAAAKAKADWDDEKEKEEKKDSKKDAASKKDWDEDEDKEKKDSAKAKKDEDEDEEEEEKGDPKKLAADKSKKDEDMSDKAKKDAAKAKKDEDEEEEKKEKADAAARKDSEERVQQQIADLAARIGKPRSDADFAAIADAQHEWDQVYSGFGQSAPRPWEGETTLGYRRRCAKEMKKHSQVWKDSDLDVVSVDPKTFIKLESAIRADAMAAANDPVNIPEDTLIERHRVDPTTGQRRIEFYGSPSAWTNQFKSGKQYVGRFGRDKS